MATKYFMAGGVDNDWSGDDNWSTTSSAGPNNTTHATSADDVILDAGSPNCTVDAVSAALSIDCTGYDSGLIQSVSTLTLDANLIVSGSITFVSGMVFDPNTYTVTIDAASTLTTGGKEFYNLTFSSTALTLGSDITVNGKFISSGALVVTGNYNINCLGDFETSGSGFIAREASSTPTLIFTGGNNQTVTRLNSGINITFNKSGNTLTFSTGTHYVGNTRTATIIYTAGTIDATTNSSILDVRDNTTTLNTNGINWYDVHFYFAAVVFASDFTIKNDMYWSNHISVTGAYTIHVEGDIYCTSATGFTFGYTAAAATLSIEGANNQQMGTTAMGIGGPVVINKSGNTLTLAGTIYYAWLVSPTWTYTAGTVSAGTSTFDIRGSCTLNTNGMSWYNVTIGNASTVTLSSAIDINNLLLVSTALIFVGAFAVVTNDLTLNANITLSNAITVEDELKWGGNIQLSGAYNISVGGNLTQTAICNLGITIAQPTLILNGSGTQIISTIAGTVVYIALNITINSSGIVQLGNDLTYENGASGHTFTYTAGTFDANSKTLSIQASCTLNTNGMNWYNLTTISSPHTVTLSSDLTVTGTLTFGVNGYWTGAYNIHAQGNITGNCYSTVALSNTTLLIDGGANQSLNMGGNNIVLNTRINKSGNTLTISSNLQLGGAFASTFTYTAGIVSAGTSTLLIAGSCTLNTNGMNWYNVTYSGTGTYTLTSALSIDGTLTVNNGVTATIATSDITASGSLTITGTGTILGRTITLDGTGTWSHTATTGSVQSNLIINTAGTITLGTNVCYKTGTLTYTAGTVTVTSSTLNVLGACTLVNTSTLSRLDWNNITFGTGTYTVTCTNGLKLSGNWTNSATALTLGSEVIFDGVSTVSGSTVFDNLTINAGATVHLTSIQTFTVSGTFTAQGTSVSGITFDATSGGSKALFNVTTLGIVSYVTATDINSLGGVEIEDREGTISNTDNWLVTHPRYFINGGVNNNWSSITNWAIFSGGTGGASVPNSTYPVYLDSNSPNSIVDIVATAKSIDCTGYIGTLSQSASLTVSGSITLVAGMTFTPSTYTVTIDATSTLISGGKTFYNLSIAGAVTLSTNNLNISGSLTMTSGSITGQTIILDGTGTWSSAGGIVYSNLTINTAGTIIISGTVYFATGTLTYTTGTVTVTSSTLSLANNCTLNTSGLTWNNIAISGAYNITLSSQLNLGGNWSNSGGTLLGSQKVYANGTHTFTGSTSFYNLELAAGSINHFTSGQTFAVTGTFTADGSLGSPITVDATTPGSRANLPVTTLGVVSYVVATDIDSSTGVTVYDNHGTLSNTINWSLVYAKYWVGGTGNWNDTAHWSDSSGGLGGEGIPDSSDNVYLDNNSGVGISTINATFGILSLDCTGYTGTLTQGANLTVSGDITLVSGMTFNPVTYTVIADATSTITSDTKEFYGFTFSGSNTFTLADDLTVNGTLSFLLGNSFVNDNTINAKGDITGDVAWKYGTSLLNITGGNNQVYSIVYNNLNTTINKSGNTLTLSGTLNYATTAGKTFTYTLGTVDAGTSAFVIGSSCTLNTNGMVWNDFYFSTTGTCTLSSDLTATGTLTIMGENITLNGSTLHAQGNVIKNTSHHWYGTTILTVDGTGIQTISMGCDNQSYVTPEVIINKSSGTLVFGTGSHYFSKGWTNLNGTVDFTTNSAITVFTNTQTITSNGQDFADVNFYEAATCTITLADNLTANSVKFDNTVGDIALNGDNIYVNGDFTKSAGSSYHVDGTTTINIVGTGPQNFALGAINTSNGHFYLDIIVNKSDILTLTGTSYLHGDLTFQSGDINLGSYALYYSTGIITNVLGTMGAGTSTLIILGGCTINTNGLNWYNVTFLNPNTTTLSSNLSIDGTLLVSAATTVSGSIIYISSNVTINDTFTGTSILYFDSGGIWTGTGAISTNITLAPSASLIISGIINYSTGTILYVDTPSGIISTSTSTLQIGGSCTLTTNGMVWGNVVISTGTTTLTNAISIGGDFNLDNTSTLIAGTNQITLGGDWTKATGATFTHGNNKVYANGVHTFTGSTIFYDLELAANSINHFTSGDTFTVLGTFTAYGNSTHSIVVNATISGSMAYLPVTTLGVVCYVNATDMDSSGGVTVTDINGVLVNTINWSAVMTGNVWDIEKAYFDGLGGSYSFNEVGVYFDALGEFSAFIEVICDLGKEEYWIYENPDELVITVESTADAQYSKVIDLMQLIPLKFHISQLLKDYIYNVGIYVGSWLASIDSMRELLNPATVGESYIQYLADLVGWKLYRTDNSTLTDLRKQLQFAVELYKKKGTYKALQYVSYVNNLHLNIWDMYCNSETNYNAGAFSKQAWFVGNYKGENPPGLDSSYFKTPHIGLEILLDKVYNSGTSLGEYLWKTDLFTSFSSQIETIRPVNVVPHYQIKAHPVTTEDGPVIIVDGNIKSKVTGSWKYVTHFFDTGENFDDGAARFDETYDAFLTDVTIWKLGIGNKGISPDDSSFSGLEDIALTGTINSRTSYVDRVDFEIIVPLATVQAGISELGLFLSDNATMVAVSLFPDIDKGNTVELVIVFSVYK